MAKSSNSRKPKASADDIAAELSFSEAQTALELALAELQDSALPVEHMAELYQRAQRYAERCEQVLKQVEQSVELWDLEDPKSDPKPYNPD